MEIVKLEKSFVNYRVKDRSIENYRSTETKQKKGRKDRKKKENLRNALEGNKLFMTHV